MDIDSARDFIRLLTGDENSNTTFQVFYDPKGEVQRPDLAKHWVANLDDSLEFLKWSQSQKCGVYVGVNESDGHGRENSNIVKYRCVFADFDGTTEPVWALTPHFVQKRDETHGHAFWLVSDIVSADEFKALQKRIAIHHNTDQQVTDPARVVRLAGTVHYKDPNNPAVYTVTDDNTDGDFKYTKQDIINAFTLTAQQDAELNQWIESRGGLLNGTGYEHNERYTNQFINWLQTKAPVAVVGSGSFTVIMVASYAHDYGIPLPETQEIMWEIYNPRCEPPWLDREKQQFYDIVERAYRYATSAAGCKTAVAGFSSQEPLAEPVGGWEENKKLNQTTAPTISVDATTALASYAEDGRLDAQRASALLAQLNNKSSHYDLALSIDGLTWQGSYLIRCEKIFYLYDGKIWSEVSDDVIKAKVQRFYSAFKPSDSFVRGVFASLCDLVNVPRAIAKNGHWIDGSGRNCDNIIVYENGIVDLNTNDPQVEPHSRNFFCFNKRSYNYNRNAKCPAWLAFLHSIWGNDEKLKMQLQEWIGYLLSNSNDLQKFALLVGFSRGGKGVLSNIIREVIGVENTVGISLDKLNKDSSLEAMSKASLCLIPDAHSVAHNNRGGVISCLKAITGNDPTSYHKMYKGTQTEQFKVRFMMSTNNMPDFSDASGALANRALVFPFTRSFVGKEDPELFGKLKREIEGISQWALEGLTRLRANNGKFTESEAGLVEKEEIREDMFPLSQYVNSMCIVDETAQCTTDKLYNAYRLWCTFTGTKSPMTEIQFSKTLRASELHLMKTKLYIDGKEVRGFKGIKLRPDLSASVLGFKNETFVS